MILVETWSEIFPLVNDFQSISSVACRCPLRVSVPEQFAVLSPSATGTDNYRGTPAYYFGQENDEVQLYILMYIRNMGNIFFH